MNNPGYIKSCKFLIPLHMSRLADLLQSVQIILPSQDRGKNRLEFLRILKNSDASLPWKISGCFAIMHFLGIWSEQMPLYEYKCSKCGAVFEVLQKVSEPPLKKCIKCGGSVTKLITAAAIQFKGSGWYVNDYAHKEKNAAHPETMSVPQAADSSSSHASKKAESEKTAKNKS